jgi:hypothetical protein
MFFLLRMAFWLSLVLILLPSGSAQHGAPVSDVGASDAISAASATVGDVRQFCSRQPDACTVGSQVATTLGYKAQAGAKMVYDFLTERLPANGTGSLVKSGLQRAVAGKSVPDKPFLTKASQNTLTSTDLAPAWRGPVARKDAKHAA